ncbi:MAG: hypothetical protein LBO68_01335 [Synergistaceae bacterium]|nr:hypothetical protein [Synergistaceae bacterium]
MTNLVLMGLVMGICCAAGVFCASDAYGAPLIEYPPEVMEAFRKEPPLNQRDIDAFIKFAPSMKLAPNGQIDTSPMRGSGVSEMRGSYVMAKLAYAIAMAMDPNQGQLLMQLSSAPSFMTPSAKEIELAQKNMEKLKTALNIPAF